MNQVSDLKPLSGRIAVVAGATRGAGRGIAVALGEAGATVICTGRTSTSKTIFLRRMPRTVTPKVNDG